MNRDIAIIGMSGRFPDAKNIDELLENLKTGKDSIKELSLNRIEQMTISKKKKYKRCGYLDEVDKFDYLFFGISHTEAKAMCPEQRMLLETTYNAIENSGYSPEHFYGSNTAVIAVASSSNYYEHAEEKLPTLYTGNAPEYLAGILGRYFNLKGSVFVVDTSCSSSTTALQIACNELLAGDADQVIVAGATVQLFPYEDDNIGLNVESPDGRSRAFSNEANGMSRGEIVATLILKPLVKAVEDKDNIQAIIKGTAVVYNGNQSANIAAPDSGSQADTILKAWKKAGVTAKDISNIEVHGSGTKLGDSLEIEALNTAFKTFTNEVKFCPISSIKTNIGHTLSGAGLAGVIKMILSLKHQYFFPSLHFNTPSELIDFNKASVYVNTELKHWEVKEGGTRIGGVCSSGASGTNGHIVLQEYQRVLSSSNTTEHYHIPVSAKTKEALQRNLKELSVFISKNPNVNIQDMSYTLTKGRSHYEYRNSYLVNSVSELENKINIDLEEDNYYHLKTENHKLVFVFSESSKNCNDQLIRLLKNKYEVFKSYWEQCEAGCKLETSALKQFAFQLSLYYLIESLELTSENLLTLQFGNSIYDVINGEKSLEDALKEVKSYTTTTIEDVESKANLLVKNQSENSEVTFIDFAGEGLLYPYLNKYNGIENEVSYVSFKTDETEDPLPKLIHLLYARGYNTTSNYTSVENTQGVKIELPTYQFEKDRCWLKETYTEDKEESIFEEHSVETTIESPIEEKLKSILNTFLNDTNTTVKSIIESETQQAFIEALNKAFFIELKGLEIVETYKELTQLITEQLTTEAKVAFIWNAILGTKNLTFNDSFFDIGGHSIFATQITNLINNEFNINIAFDDVYEYETIATLAKYIDSILWISKYEQDSTNYEVII
jgi:acyl transferase domain-containing protein